MKPRKVWGSVRFYRPPEGGRGSTEHAGTKIAYSEEDARRAVTENPTNEALAAAHARNVRAEVYNAKGTLVALYARDRDGKWNEVRTW